MTTERAWIGQFSPSAFDKIGLRHKYFHKEWEEPYENHVVPLDDDIVSAASKRYTRGELLSRGEFTEASAVYSPSHFKKEKEFSRAGIGYIIDSRVHDVLSPFDLGPGGLFEYPIFESDQVTPIAEQWWMLGLGSQKKTFVAAESKGFKTLFDGQGKQNSFYRLYSTVEDNDICLTQEALEGSDLWCEPELRSVFGFSDALAQALIAAGLDSWFNLKRARIVG